MAVHSVAAEGFDTAAEIYETSRPGYPPEVVDWLLHNLALGPESILVDLAAGTGKLTRLLAANGTRPIAVEPVSGMRAVLRRVSPDIPIVAGTAEAIPIRDGAVDALTCAQAFHWFDHPAGHAELARVIRPGGRIALIWNARDRSVGWVDAVWSVMDRVEKRAPWRNHEAARASRSWSLPGFGPFERHEVFHQQAMTPEMVIQRLASVSHVAVLPAAERRGVLDEVRDLLHTHPETSNRAELAMRYRVDCYWAERD